MEHSVNPRRRNGHRRNQLRKQVLAEETCCAICGNPVDVDIPAGLPESPEIDEVVPVSLGGNPYSRENCRLTHRICNQRRGNGTRQQRKPLQPFITQRTW
jgi:5-methylcytosine-specific restriction endonuclease McrA